MGAGDNGGANAGVTGRLSGLGVGGDVEGEHDSINALRVQNEGARAHSNAGKFGLHSQQMPRQQLRAVQPRHSCATGRQEPLTVLM